MKQQRGSTVSQEALYLANDLARDTAFPEVVGKALIRDVIKHSAPIKRKEACHSPIVPLGLVDPFLKHIERVIARPADPPTNICLRE